VSVFTEYIISSGRRFSGKTRRAYRMAAFVCVILTLLIGCSSHLDLAGTGSQAGNGRVECMVIHDNGTPAAMASVTLRRRDYLAEASVGSLLKSTLSAIRTTTDMQGFFSIDSLDTGNYCIEISDKKSNGSLLTFSIVEGNDFVELPRDTLRPVGAIRGVVISQVRTAGSLFLQVYGLERAIVPDLQTGSYSIADLPAGTYTLRAFLSSSDSAAQTVSSIVVTSGATTVVDTITLRAYGILKYSTRIYFNTTLSGANVSGAVVNFPVLIRLTDSTFNFDQARSDGADVRFYKPSGAALLYEIERWDSFNKRAEIWVKMDTVLGNTAEHYVNMYWGNSSALSESNSAAVFDTGNGYRGVWHLDENAGGGANSLVDQTAWSYNGTPHGAMMNSGLEGIVGTAASFNGIDDYITVPRPIQDDFTIAFWMKADTNSHVGTQWWDGEGLVDGDIAGVQDGDFGVAYLNSRPVFGTCCNDQTLDANQTVNDAQWHYVAVTRQKSDGAKIIYVDGAPQGSQTGTTLTLSGPDSLAFGKILAYASAFKGKLDEIQISGVVRSADWIKLCFANQSLSGAFIQIRPKP
jgi:hypothetical protein